MGGLLPVCGCALISVPVHGDNSGGGSVGACGGGGGGDGSRLVAPGSLSCVEFGRLPFQPHRSFLVTVSAAPALRGSHAHRRCLQILQCAAGAVRVTLDDGSSRSEVTLTPHGPALLVGRMVWSTQLYLQPGSALLALCSEPHDPTDYIRDWGTFLSLARLERRPAGGGGSGPDTHAAGPWQDPGADTLGRLLARLPPPSKVVILSLHGYCGQTNVLGSPGTGSQAECILDQVRAMEREPLLAGLWSGQADIVVLTRLIPGTSCNERLEPISGCRNARILRVPFRDHEGHVTCRAELDTVSSPDLRPYLERFTIDAAEEILAEMGGKPDFIIVNSSDDNLVATLMSRRMNVTHTRIVTSTYQALLHSPLLRAASYPQDEQSALPRAPPPAECAVRHVNVAAAAFVSEDGLRAAFERVLRSGRYTLGGRGCEVAAFEAEWAAFCQAAHCVAVGSGAAALSLLLLAAGIGPGDEVVVASNSYAATVFAVLHVGASPVLAEPDPATRNLTAAAAATAFTPRTRAVLSTDMGGVPVEYAALAEAAHARGAWLFSDAAHAHGAQLHGRPVGALADAAAFSFYPTKNLGALGEAGAVVTGCPALAVRIAALRDYGRVPAGTLLPPPPLPPQLAGGSKPAAPYASPPQPPLQQQREQQPQQQPQQPAPQPQQLAPPQQQREQHELPPPPPEFQAVGFNERMDPLQAAFLRAKLADLPGLLAARRRVAEAYMSALRGLDWLRLPGVPPGAQPSWHLFIVECAVPAERDALRRHLAARGIEAPVHYPQPPHLMHALRGHALLRAAAGSSSGDGVISCDACSGVVVPWLPVAEGLAARVLSLPVCPFLTDGQVVRVIAAVLEFDRQRAVRSRL